MNSDCFLWQLKDKVRKELKIETEDIVLGMYRRCNSKSDDFIFHSLKNDHYKLRQYHIHNNDTVRVRIQPSKGSMLGFRRSQDLIAATNAQKKWTDPTNLKIPWAQPGQNSKVENSASFKGYEKTEDQVNLASGRHHINVNDGFVFVTESDDNSIKEDIGDDKKQTNEKIRSGVANNKY
ncbi:hypothetical protein RFI_24833 [Reticulomyxa filosa]|uniref:Ubiquitin-like domain-containing protein n=1 Tax=Reticulomyxa filosa TaxID=46433 RepID=X6MFT5_RETFI|nr:hypothetical protein RFI_24833 [Reticulomyxa filosa]|eukprot:ETO12541.1 hypothetical protein RFI_24833 [Reticulomyxa filosa]